MENELVFELIKNSSNINDAKIRELLPEPNNETDYYFVSYSHLDYKPVLIDIICFIERGLNIWYDKGLEAGKSWIDDVIKKIESFHCKGAVIYLSQNYQNSESCKREYSKLQELNKDVIFITLDNSLDHLISEEMTNILQYEDDIDTKVSYIASMQGEELLEFEFEKMNFIGYRAFLSGAKDKSITKLDIPSKYGKYKVVGIKEGALSNCINLEEITLPKGFLTCGKEAFRNCYSLKRININPPFKMFGLFRTLMFNRCFSGCLSLTSLDDFHSVNGKKYNLLFKSPFAMNNTGIEQLVIDKNHTFEGLAVEGLENLKKIIFNDFQVLKRDQYFTSKSLKEVEFAPQCKSKYTSKYMFSNCPNLEKVIFNNNLRYILESAFEDDVKLKEIDLPERLDFIGFRAFANCQSLTSVHFKKYLTSLFSNAFKECINLKEVRISSKKMKIVDSSMYKFSNDLSIAFPNIDKLYLIKGSKLIVPSYLKEVESDDINYVLYMRGDKHE